ncbi:hypothetical protein AWJ20_4707 [Sugiyamaella lignohabitans]|uniref:Elongin-A n=1 Tax=Sugiyamaella lignohabitans TaxID=796027 RepID=A0A167E883_9ASCO|nr:uncharacterized protein AWJ20_4707 [Sugiyamaella lignohabitans]ANB13762.1 hypothetical protein AWJ20_4707 [Sugiyamaella lignohabitans]
MSARQLSDIEKKSPQIRSRSDELWKLFITRDFPDRPVSESHNRRAYAQYYKEKEAHLKNASSRLRESLEKIKQEKASRTITSLEVDPQSLRAAARRKASSSAPAGSRLIQKAFNSARTKGPLFSSRNTKFASMGMGSINGLPPGIPGAIRAPRSIPPPAMRNVPTPSPLSMPLNARVRPTGPVSPLKPAVATKPHPTKQTAQESAIINSPDNRKKPKIDTPPTTPTIAPATRKRPNSSIFLQRRK